MRFGILIVSVVVAMLASGCKPSQESSSQAANSLLTKAGPSLMTVEAGCAMCVYKMEGVSGCKLAVRVDGRPYLVKGSDINDHGDAHAADGLCQVARAAVTMGAIEGDKFVATKFRLNPSAPENGRIFFPILVHEPTSSKLRARP